MDLSGFPRALVAHLPTPLEKLDRLTRELGGPEIWIKRDDCTGLSTGGNKSRKLEFLMGQAQALSADTVVTTGSTQSNHVRQTAAFAARLGMDCHVLLGARHPSNDWDYNHNGNVLLNHLHGANIIKCTGLADVDLEVRSLSKQLSSQGRKVFVIPLGGSTPEGALGYVDCALELASQAEHRNLVFDHLVTASGTAGTQAGLAVGLKVLNAGIQVTGISVRAPRETLEHSVYDLALKTAALVARPEAVVRQDIIVDGGYVGPGYGIPGDETLNAIRMLAELEGILVDPVYSGKAAAGLIDYCRKARFKKGERVVFLHTGGSAALFGYRSYLRSGADRVRLDA